MLVLGLAITAADAQTWTEDVTGVLVAQPGTITQNGVGSPSVAWDPVLERYMMFFETRTGAATADCTGGLWSIGVASSADGVAWDVFPSAVVAPTPNTPWRCVAAHPTVVYDAGTYHLWFKAEQGLNACAAGAKAWGCNSYSGISHAVVDLDLDDKTADIAIVEQDIDLVEAERATALDDLATAVSDYQADLLANQSEFGCTDPALDGICAPCASFMLDAPEEGSDTQPLCQDFSFVIPARVNVASNSSGHTVTLSFTTTAGANVSCLYRKNNGDYVLDNSSGGGIAARCATPNQTLVAGSAVTTRSGVTIAINAGPATPNVWVTLDATNIGTQTFDGTLLDTADDLAAAAAANDYDGALALLDGFQGDLQDLVTWYAPFTPLDPQKTQLETDGGVLLTQVGQLEADLPLWADELDDLDVELQALLDYEQSVDVVSLLNQVGVQINKTFGFPAAMKKGAGWVLMFQDYPNIWRATSNNPDGPFVVDAAPVASAGTVGWAMTEVYEPNLMCTSDPVFDYQMYFGGRTVTAGTFTNGGISDGVSTDTVTWLLNTATQFFGWTDANEFRHFDVIRASNDQLRMWYTERVGGAVQVNMAATTAAYTDALSTQRVCP